MSEYKRLMVNNINSNPIWLMLEDNFDKYWMNYNENKDDIIPKKIHQVWLGGNIPDKYIKLADEIKQINQGWEYKLWTDDDVDEFNPENIDIIKNNNFNFGLRSDIFRYEILYREGGIYLDTDFVGIKSFDDMCYLDFFSGVGHVDKPQLFNGLFGCVKNSEILKISLDEIKKIKDLSNINYEQIMNLTGPYFLSNIVFDYCLNNKNSKIVVLPTKYFYALPAVDRFSIRNYNNRDKEFIKGFLTKESYVVHLWDTSWQK